MKRLISVICLTLCLLSMSACQKKADSSATPQDTQTFFHHAEWNMSKEELRQAVGADKIKAGSVETILNWTLTDELSYIFGERRVSVAYLFNEEDALTSITVQAYTNDGESIEQAMADTRKAMDAYYGTSEGEDKNAHWHTETAVISIVELQGASASFIIQYVPADTHSH